TTKQEEQETQAQKTLEGLEKAEKYPGINTILLQQLGVGQSPWTIVQLDQLSGSAMEGYRPVKHKIEIETTHQQKAMDSPSNINKPTELDYTLFQLELKLIFEC
ncbi:MAG: hypothetical protein EZS28_026626, partial [Streblomastix strix]